MPLMSMPRIAAATVSASSADPASFTPPALPRPPTRTCALITTRSAPPARIRSAAARASAGVLATSQPGHRQSLREEEGLGVGLLELHAGRAPRVGSRCGGRGTGARDQLASSGQGVRGQAVVPSRAVGSARMRPFAHPIPRSPVVGAQLGGSTRAWRSRERAPRSGGRRSSRPGPRPRASGRPRGPTPGRWSRRPSRSASGRSSSTRCSPPSCGARCSGSPTRPTATCRRSSRRSSAPAPADVVLAGDPHPVDPARLPDHLLLLPEGVLPVLLRRPAGVCRRRALGPPALRDGGDLPVHPPEPPPLSSCTSRSSRCSSCGSTRSWLRPEGGMADRPGRRDPVRQCRPADRLLAVLPLAAPPRGRAARLLLVHRPDADALLALAAADRPQRQPHGLGLGQPDLGRDWPTCTSGCSRAGLFSDPAIRL